MDRSVLLIDDDADAVDVVRFFLQQAGFGFEAATTGAEGLERFQQTDPDVVILDLGLPDMDGSAVFRAMRAHSRVPVLMLTGRAREADRLYGFDLGADDYVTKPFSPHELVARVKAILRRTAPDVLDDTPHRLSAGGISLDVDRHEVQVNGRSVHVTGTQLRILAVLLRDPGRVVSRAELLVRVYGNSYERDDRTVDAHVSNLRRKMEEAGSQEMIQSIYGRGYKFVVS